MNPRCVHRPLRDLIHEIDTVLRGSEPDPGRVAAVLQGHLGQPDLLAPHHRRASADAYRTNVVHVAPDGAFSLVALVWLPGQRTSIHSHRSWCVVGVHEGIEEERTFIRAERDGAPVLQLDDVRRYAAGSVTWMTTADEIHDVANGGATPAISLHVYGVDYRYRRSSILEAFDLPIVLPAAAPAPALTGTR